MYQELKTLCKMYAQALGLYKQSTPEAPMEPDQTTVQPAAAPSTEPTTPATVPTAPTPPITNTPRPKKQPTIPTKQPVFTDECFDPLAIDPPGQQKGKKNGKNKRV